MRLVGADASVYVEPGAPVADERGDVLRKLGAVGLGYPIAPGDARARAFSLGGPPSPWWRGPRTCTLRPFARGLRPRMGKEQRKPKQPCPPEPH